MRHFNGIFLHSGRSLLKYWIFENNSLENSKKIYFFRQNIKNTQHTLKKTFFIKAIFMYYLSLSTGSKGIGGWVRNWGHFPYKVVVLY